jgi:hypothetical protein
MKWKDHRRLITAVTQKQNVPLAAYRGLLEGVIYPDKINSWRKENGESLESHHNPSTEKISDLITHARLFWLKGEENDAGFQLGQALHYIHDGLVSKGLAGLFHDSNENKIQILDIHEKIIESAMKDSISDPFYVEELVRRVSSQESEKAFETATYITASLIRAVMNHQTIPTGLEDEYRNAYTQHSKYLKAGITGGAVLFLTGVFINSILLIIFAPILSIIIAKTDRSYYRIEKKWKWFNIVD